MAKDFDPKALVKIGERLASQGVDPCELLANALSAERSFDWSTSLAELLSKNDPARAVDVVNAPTFQRRLREVRITLRTIGVGPDLYAVPPEGGEPYQAIGDSGDLPRVLAALSEMKAVGTALRIVGPKAPKGGKRRVEELYLEQTEHGVTITDDEGMPVLISSVEEMRPRHHYRPIGAIERYRRALESLLAETKKVSKGCKRKDEIIAALDRDGQTPPPMREYLAQLLAASPRGMSTEQIAVCGAYGVRADRATAETLMARSAERRKKRRARGRTGDIHPPRMSPG